MAIQDFIVPLVILAGLIILAMGIRGSIRRGPTLSDRYQSASEEERRELDKQMEQHWWLRAKIQPLSGWDVVGALIMLVVLMMIKKWLAT